MLCVVSIPAYEQDPVQFSIPCALESGIKGGNVVLQSVSCAPQLPPSCIRWVSTPDTCVCGAAGQVKGKMVLSDVLNKLTYKQNVYLEATGLNAGSYVLRVRDGGTAWMTRVTVYPGARPDE